MAALLVDDRCEPGPAEARSWQTEAHAATYGGLLRIPYAPASPGPLRRCSVIQPVAISEPAPPAKRVITG